jgi:hypothetical protein
VPNIGLQAQHDTQQPENARCVATWSAKTAEILPAFIDISPIRLWLCHLSGQSTGPSWRDHLLITRAFPPNEAYLVHHEV